MKKEITISLAVLTLLVVASTISTGCSKQTAKSTNDDGIVIGWLQKNATLTFETVINSGVVPYLAEAKKNGVIKDYITFDGNTDPAIQINQAYDLINLKVNAAIIQPAEADGSAPAVQALHEAGIPVIAVNSTTSNTSELAASFVGSNDVEAGEIMGRYILDTLGNIGAYCHLQGIIGTSSSIQRTEGIHNVMDKVSGWKCWTSKAGNGQVTKQTASPRTGLPSTAGNSRRLSATMMICR
jgi:ABC-type sugar transport system substrate-binding protein